jgi:hypothetical protein
MSPEPGILGRLSVGSSGGSRKPAQEQSNRDQIAREIAAAFIIWMPFGFVPAIDRTWSLILSRSGLPRRSIFCQLQNQMIIQPILGYPCLPTFGAQFDYWAGLIDGRLWIPSPQIIIGEDRTKLARLIGGIVVQMPKPAGLQNVADEDYVGYLHEIYKKAFEYKD